MYHRIAIAEYDPWQLAVSPENFEEHLKVMQKYNIVPCEMLAEQVVHKSVVSETLCVTFDDGYIDNFLNAKPLLERYGVPATFFITSDKIGNATEFWWDELSTIFLEQDVLPGILSLDLAGKNIEYEIKEPVLSAIDKQKHKEWKWPATPPTGRCQLYLSVWEKLKPLSNQSIDQVIRQLKVWAGIDQQYTGERHAMGKDQLSSLFDNKFITIGAHTDSHPCLSSHDSEIQHNEILKNKMFLEDLGNKPVRTIAYPYGQYNADSIGVVKELQFSAAFTTHEHPVSNNSKQFELPRFQVNNWSGKKFGEHLNQWFNSN